ncbi:hypothetical protein SLS62_007560 [Diatrype stigma]|uniref:Uncharacterized protein n=1 Tax=Diatrype stigma TaxID=117547 RepID=A0AAN9UP00_9PEZI
MYQYNSLVPPAGNVSNPGKAKKKREKKKRSQYTWTTEFGAVALCLAAVITTIVLLIYADGLPLVRYNFILSFNAVVSILGAVARVTLGFALGSCLGQAKWNFFRRGPGSLAAFGKFEDASRGPWGSLWLLAWLRIRHWAGVGALITVLLLGFEPFLQAVIYYAGDMEPLSNAASSEGGMTTTPPPLIARSIHLDAGVYYKNNAALYLELLPDNTTIAQVPFSSRPDLGMISALFQGFYNGADSSSSSSSSATTTSFTCPTGNCTWAPFASIATCSACHDVTDQLQRRTEHGSNLGTINYHTRVYDGEYLMYDLPSYGANLSNAIDIRDFAAYMAARPRTQPADTLGFRDLDTLIAAVGVVRAADSYRDGTTAWNETEVKATECALWFCTSVYASEVAGGVLQERVLASWADRDPDSYRLLPNKVATDEEMAAFDEYYDHPLWVDGVEFERSDLELRIPAEGARQYNLSLPPTTSGSPGGDDDSSGNTNADPGSLSFSITQRTIGSSMQYISTDFFQVNEGSNSGSSSGNSNSGSGNTGLLVWPVSGDDGATVGQPPVTQALYESTNLSATFDNAARSLSDWMRNRGDSRSSGAGSNSNTNKRGDGEESMVQGTALQYVIRIRVNWAYLSLPLATIVAGCLFVLFSVLETRRLGLQPWKTDVTATLIHSLDPETRNRLRMAEAEMEPVAASGVGEEEGDREKNKNGSRKSFVKVVESTVVRIEDHSGSADDSGGLQLRAAQEDSTPAVSDDEGGENDNGGNGSGGSIDRSVSALSREEQLRDGDASAAEYEYRAPEEYSAWGSVVWRQPQRQQE